MAQAQVAVNPVNAARAAIIAGLIVQNSVNPDDRKDADLKAIDSMNKAMSQYGPDEILTGEEQEKVQALIAEAREAIASTGSERSPKAIKTQKATAAYLKALPAEAPGASEGFQDETEGEDEGDGFRASLRRGLACFGCDRH